MNYQIENQEEMIKKANTFELNLLFNNDIEICNYVNNQLFYSSNPLFKGKKITKKELFIKSLDHFKTFSPSNYQKLYNLIQNTEIIQDTEFHNAGVMLSYSLHELFQNKVIENSGSIAYYCIPKILYPMHIYTLGHEHCHALKDTNFKEHKDGLTFGETIPMFYELFSLNPNNAYAKKALQIRMHYLWKDKKNYQSAYETYQQNKFPTSFAQELKEKNINDLKISQAGAYLNSFYYAIILYHLYKENPNKILSLIEKVLSQDITTYELLTQLDIYGDIQGEIFEQELHSLKKVLRK